MSHSLCVVLLTGVAAFVANSLAAAEEARDSPKPALKAVGLAPVGAGSTSSVFGVKPVDAKVLASKRGGSDVANDMQLRGVVADNRAVNVATGNNVISEGAFAATVGLPMVVQNTGNNVLIQNATIVNVQVK